MARVQETQDHLWEEEVHWPLTSCPVSITWGKGGLSSGVETDSSRILSKPYAISRYSGLVDFPDTCAHTIHSNLVHVWLSQGLGQRHFVRQMETQAYDDSSYEALTLWWRSVKKHSVKWAFIIEQPHSDSRCSEHTLVFESLGPWEGFSSITFSADIGVPGCKPAREWGGPITSRQTQLVFCRNMLMCNMLPCCYFEGLCFVFKASLYWEYRKVWEKGQGIGKECRKRWERQGEKGEKQLGETRKQKMR